MIKRSLTEVFSYHSYAYPSATCYACGAVLSHGGRYGTVMNPVHLSPQRLYCATPTGLCTLSRLLRPRTPSERQYRPVTAASSERLAVARSGRLASQALNLKKALTPRAAGRAGFFHFRPSASIRKTYVS